ncbi:MAG: hypothetical protein OEQ24_10675 [Gammaproteobacteria bacterium]|nr:hypothetical protein [Gammaproteobacteria bacterium]
MDTALVDVNKLNIDIPSSGNGEMAFVYNILAPDLLLFTSGISLAFGFLIYIF